MTRTSCCRSRRFLSFLLVAVLLVVASSQDYDDPYGHPQGSGGGQGDFSQDTIYHDYAARHEQRDIDIAAKGGPAWGSIIAGTAVGWFAGGKFHSGRVRKKLQKKHKEEQKALYKQYYSDVLALQTQNQDLADALESMGVKITYTDSAGGSSSTGKA